MELLKIITRSTGGDDYIDNAVNYLFDERCVLRQGYGVSPYYPESATTAIKQTTEFWGNQNKNQIIHAILSFSQETAPTPDVAMRKTAEIMEPITKDHLSISGCHSEERAGSLYHTHTVSSTTNINDGTMIHVNNSTIYELAQRVADVTNQPAMLVVENDKKEEWECPKKFLPQSDDEE